MGGNEIGGENVEVVACMNSADEFGLVDSCSEVGRSGLKT